MKKRTFETIILEASDGMVLTNKENEFFTKTVYLGSEDSVDNYIEIPEEEVENLKIKE